MELYDQNGNPSWWDNTGATGASMNPASTGAAGMNASWGSNSVTLSGFGGYGQNVGWQDYLKPNDVLTFYLALPDGITTSYVTAYPSDAPMPTVTLNAMPTLDTGGSEYVSGSVTFKVYTNATTSQWSIGYTAPSTPGTYTITVSIADQATTINVNVS